MERIGELLAVVFAFATGFLGTHLPVPPADVAIPARTERGTILEIIDGDTVVADVAGQREFVRYIGIDTPERGREGAADECFAAEATRRNGELVSGKTAMFVADEDDRDTYNRLLRYVYVDDGLVQEELLDGGFARTLPFPPNTRHADAFAAREKTAREARAGMWEACTEQSAILR